MRPRAMLCRRAGSSCWRSCNQYRGGPPACGWVGAIVRHEAGHAAARTNRDAPLRPDGPAAVAADLDGALYRRQLVRVPAGGDRPSAVDVRRCRADAGPRRAPSRRGPAGAPHLPLQRGGAPAPRPQAAATPPDAGARPPSRNPGTVNVPPAAAVERIGVQRQLLTEKVATSVAVLTLAVGIGASTAVFTVISIVLRPLPVAEPDRLARLHLGDPQEDAWAYRVWEEIDRRSEDVFAGAFASSRTPLRARGCGPVHSPLRAGGGGWRRQADRGGRRRPRLGGKPLEGLAGDLSLRSFLDLDVTEAAPDHSTLSRTRRADRRQDPRGGVHLERRSSAQSAHRQAA